VAEAKGKYCVRIPEGEKKKHWYCHLTPSDDLPAPQFLNLEWFLRVGGEGRVRKRGLGEEQTTEQAREGLFGIIACL
jgi:hypothetical protein